VTGRRGIRRRKLLDYLKERRGYSHLKEEVLVRTVWRVGFGRGFGPVVRQTAKCIRHVPLMSVVPETELSPQAFPADDNRCQQSRLICERICEPEPIRRRLLVLKFWRSDFAPAGTVRFLSSVICLVVWR
jgi:hypothetical protein